MLNLPIILLLFVTLKSEREREEREEKADRGEYNILSERIMFIFFIENEHLYQLS